MLNELYYLENLFEQLIIDANDCRKDASSSDEEMYFVGIETGVNDALEELRNLIGKEVERLAWLSF